MVFLVFQVSFLREFKASLGFKFETDVLVSLFERKKSQICRKAKPNV